jgi:hypothetical protein
MSCPNVVITILHNYVVKICLYTFLLLAVKFVSKLRQVVIKIIFVALLKNCQTLQFHQVTAYFGIQFALIVLGLQRKQLNFGL